MPNRKSLPLHMAPAHPSRRSFIAGAAGLAATVGLAGCTTAGSLDPNLPGSKLASDGWRQVANVEERTQETVDLLGRPQRITLEARGEAYENNRPAQELARRYGVEADDSTIPAMGFIAAKARMKPPITRILSFSDRVMTHAVDLAEERALRALNDRGFEDVHRVETDTLDILAGPTGDHRTYRASYSYETFEVRFRGRPVTVQAGTFDVEAQLGVWPYRGLLTTGAGLYPAEPGDLMLRSGGFTKEFSLQLEPDRYREQVRRLITMIS